MKAGFDKQLYHQRIAHADLLPEAPEWCPLCGPDKPYLKVLNVPADPTLLYCTSCGEGWKPSYPGMLQRMGNLDYFFAVNKG